MAPTQVATQPIPAVNPQVLGSRDRYATWASRVGARLIDFVFLLAISATLFVVIVQVMGVALGPAEILTFYLINTVVSLLYFAFQYFRPGLSKGQTPGKQVLGIKLIRIDEQPLSAGTYLLREWGTALLGAVTFGLFTTASAFWPLFDDRRQALSDKIANTYVINLRTEQAMGRPVPPIGSTPIVIGAVIAAVLMMGAIGVTTALTIADESDPYDYAEITAPEANESGDATAAETERSEPVNAAPPESPSGLLPDISRDEMAVEIQDVLIAHHDAIVSEDYRTAWSYLSERKQDQYEREDSYGGWKQNQKTLTPYIDPSGLEVEVVGLDEDDGVATVNVTGMAWTNPRSRCSEWSGITWARYENGEWRYDPGYSTTPERRRKWKPRADRLIGWGCA